jgi:hypothetical protein
MKKLKKVRLSSKDLDKNIDLINAFLTKKGMSTIVGGYGEWGSTNYAESTCIRR